MSSVPKIGGKQYFATSKNVNKMLNQLNGVLASGNITVQTVTMGASSTVTIDLSAGNFINLTLNTINATNTLSFTNITAGVYYFKIKNGQNSASANVTFNSSNSTGAYGITNTSSTCTDLYLSLIHI